MNEEYTITQADSALIKAHIRNILKQLKVAQIQPKVPLTSTLQRGNLNIHREKGNK